MNDERPRPSSRILSWIAGSAFKDDESVVGQPMRRNRSSSLRSFIPSIRNASKVENSFLSLPRSVSSGQRPEPFFYPRPLDREREREDEYSFMTATEEVSISSLTSAEIALWKQGTNVEVSRARTTRKRTFSGFSSLLTRKKAREKSPPPQTPKDGTLPELPLEDSFVECRIEDTEDPITMDHLTSLPELTFSSYSQKRSSDIPSLLPPPRSKRESISISADWSLWNKQAKCTSRGISIDAAKWAEISISAADLVRIYGHENVIIQNADEYPSSDLEMEDVVPMHAHESFMEMDEDSPQSSPQSKSMAHQETGSSFVGSMVSFSKWPLPPQCEQFGMEKLNI